MSSKTIAKFLAFVISISALVLAFTACGAIKPSSAERAVNDAFFPPRNVGKIANPDVVEASGLAASKCQPDVFWTHNDSGDGAFIFAVNTAGENLGTWRIPNAQNNDWEDIAEFKDATGKCYVYIGDIGNNGGKQRAHSIYRVAEPIVSAGSRNTTEKNTLVTEPAEMLSFSYPSKVHDAETLIVHPVSGDIYVLSKSKQEPSVVYKLSPVFGSNQPLQARPIAEIRLPSIPLGLLTGGDAASDGRRVILCDYIDGYELTLPAGDNTFDDIWKQQPVRIDLGPRDTGEAVTYNNDAGVIYATTEGAKAPIIEVRRK